MCIPSGEDSGGEDSRGTFAVTDASSTDAVLVIWSFFESLLTVERKRAWKLTRKDGCLIFLVGELRLLAWSAAAWIAGGNAGSDSCFSRDSYGYM
jgi:hypothetical protein